MGDISKTGEGIDLHNDALAVLRKEKCLECFTRLQSDKVFVMGSSI